ncbi:MAG TPA: chromosomal replication initiator protein DnaA, partial [Firmicutes bacterium]|nr:chromosomal replication initiator protein DnaA [Bacillota bacterium]
MTELTNLWGQVLKKLQRDLSKPSFETWLKPTQPITLVKNTLVIGVPNEFARDWLETRYASLLQEAVQDVLKLPLAIDFVIIDDQEGPRENTVKRETAKTFSAVQMPRENFTAPVLNPKYTFDTFVVGNSNRFAHAASLAVAEAPAKAY